MRRKLLLAFLLSVSSILPAQAEWIVFENDELVCVVAPIRRKKCKVVM